MITDTVKKSEYLYNLALNQMVATQFSEAIKNFKAVNPYLLKEKQYSKYLESQVFQIIMHTEMEHFNEIGNIHSELSDIIWKCKSPEMDFSKLHYAMGFCCLRRKENLKAQTHFDQAIAHACSVQKQSEQVSDQKQHLTSQIDLCYAYYGFAFLYFMKKQIAQSIQEIERGEELIKYFTELQLILEKDKTAVSQEMVQNLQHEKHSLDFSFHLLKAQILNTEKKYKQAEELLWFCYEQSQKSYRRKYMAPHLFYCLGINYMAKKDYNQASHFLSLAKRSINEETFKLLNKYISHSLNTLQHNMTHNYDIIINFETNLLIEKQKGHINFKNQFVVLDMLKLFVMNPGKVYSKEDLAAKIWKQSYDHQIHDNKIYVTIKRLRELVEPNQNKPKYICRTKDGYYINKNVKILIK